MVGMEKMTNENYITCSRCILDTKDDPSIIFDEQGVCNYCRSYDLIVEKSNIGKLDLQRKKLEEIVALIKKEGRSKKYDCVMGISGGVDSTYLAYTAKKLGLRPLVVHYDNGWNSELAVNNIHRVVQQLDFDLFTYVNDWEEFKDLQLSFLKASVLDIELLTDQAIVAVLYEQARKQGVKYILYGSNMVTEGILPKNWYHWKNDAYNIKAIHKKFGSVPMKTYPYIGFFKRLLYDKFTPIESISLLNYIPYIKTEVKELISRELGWKDYGGKHYESIFTRFYQAYYLPRKFGIDKRKAHLSTLICSGQMTREEALLEMTKEVYDKQKLQEDKEYVLKKLNLTEAEFDAIMQLPAKDHTFYPSYLNRHYRYLGYFTRLYKPLVRPFKKESGI